MEHPGLRLMAELLGTGGEVTLHLISIAYLLLVNAMDAGYLSSLVTSYST